MIHDYIEGAVYEDGQLIRLTRKDRPVTQIFVYNSKLHTPEAIANMVQGRNAKSIHDYL